MISCGLAAGVRGGFLAGFGGFLAGLLGSNLFEYLLDEGHDY